MADQPSSPDLTRLAAYDYALPPELIAHHPPAERDGARLLVVDRGQQSVVHAAFPDVVSLLKPGDALILNETRVVPARLQGIRQGTGGRWEGLFLRTDDSGDWVLIGQTRGKLQPGETISITNPRDTKDAPLELRLLERLEGGGEWRAKPQSDESFLALLERFGSVPLPPYIKRDEAGEAESADRERYQTSFARTPGSVAAPTAGLHFTPAILDRIRARGVRIGFVTLHVGLGTFRPVSAEELSAHQMHSEWCDLPAATADLVNTTKRQGGRVVAVGTTSVRTLESAAARVAPADPLIKAWSGMTDLFIRPPYRFRVVDAMLTNFHLPKSTLIILVSAFAGYDLAMRAYRIAVEERYRFFSYGDAMFIS